MPISRESCAPRSSSQVIKLKCNVLHPILLMALYCQAASSSFLNSGEPFRPKTTLSIDRQLQTEACPDFSFFRGGWGLGETQNNTEGGQQHTTNNTQPCVVQRMHSSKHSPILEYLYAIFSRGGMPLAKTL